MSGELVVRPNYYVAGQRPVIIEDAEILFRNFIGKEGMYNKEGDRNFCVIIPPNMVEGMIADGFNMKTLRPRDDTEEPRHYVSVSVNFEKKPPRCVLITSRGRNDLGPDPHNPSINTVDILDWIDIARVDLIFNPYYWGPIQGKSGVKAYCKTIFVFAREDYLEQKYADIEYQNQEDAPLELNRGPNEYDETHDIVDAELVEEEEVQF